MSTKGARDYRPRIHFTPKAGWINDPNGLVYENGRYHLFAQHYPNDTKWGPMHWLHATSADLIHWEELGIALYPDEKLGFIFSGSAVMDMHNTSGFGVGGAPMIAMFTHHGECEQQSIAYSQNGIDFTPYPGNPVIPNPGLKDFRDPKVFWNTITNGWSMVLAAGDHAEFYASRDLIHWEKTGQFGPEGNHCNGVWECPDLFPLTAPDGQTVWVLLVSMGQSPENGGGRVQYFLGDFDGNTFTCTRPFGKVVWLNAGFDDYASVTYNGELTERLIIGWGINWVYAAQTPTGVYCGNMTLPRTMGLTETSEGLRLTQQPVSPLLGPAVKAGDNFPIASETFALRVHFHGEGKIVLANEDGECFEFGLDHENRLFTDRTKAGESQFNPLFIDDVRGKTATPRVMSGDAFMDVIFDVSVAELFADNGTYVNTTVLYPVKPYSRIICHGDVEVDYYVIL